MVVASSCFILNLFQLVQREFLMICFAKRHAMHITRNTYVNCKPQRTKYTFDAERAGKTFVNFGALGTNSLPNNPSIITDPILLCVILCVGRGVAMGLLLQISNDQIIHWFVQKFIVWEILISSNFKITIIIDFFCYWKLRLQSQKLWIVLGIWKE